MKGGEESRAEELFRQIKKAVISKLGKRALYDTTLNAVGASLFGTRYLGTFTQDKVVLSRSGCQIVGALVCVCQYSYPCLHL